MNNGIVKIVLSMSSRDTNGLFVDVARRGNSHGYYPTGASIKRLNELIRLGKVSFYPLLTADNLLIVLGRKGW